MPGRVLDTQYKLYECWFLFSLRPFIYSTISTEQCPMLGDTGITKLS